VKVKLVNEDELTGYVSVKKMVSLTDTFKYKLTVGQVMASQSSDKTITSGFVTADNQDTAIRMVHKMVYDVTQGDVGYDNEKLRQWCFNFVEPLRVLYPYQRTVLEERVTSALNSDPVTELYYTLRPYAIGGQLLVDNPTEEGRI
jgi:hypothetical protein